MVSTRSGRRGRKLSVVTPGEAAPGGPYILAVPGTEAPIMDVSLPDGVRGEARRRVARQQIADRIGLPPDEIAVCPVDAAGKTGWRRAVVVGRETLESWASGTGADCRAIVPDYLLLPAAPERVSVDFRDGVALVRLGEEDGFSAPAGVAGPVLEHALSASPQTAALVSPRVPAEIVAIIQRAGLDMRQDDEPFSEADFASEPGCDLRRAIAAERAPQGLGLWATAAALGLIAFAVWSASVFIETRAIERQRLALAAETEDILRQGLIPTGPLLDVRTQVSRRMAELEPTGEGRDDLAALDLLSRVTVSVFGKGFDVGSIVVSDRALSLDLTGPDFESAELLASDFAAAGLQSRTDTLRAREGGGVEARFTILSATGEDG